MNYFCGCQLCNLWIKQHYWMLYPTCQAPQINSEVYPQIKLENTFIQFNQDQLFLPSSQRTPNQMYIEPDQVQVQQAQEVSETQIRSMKTKNSFDQKEGRNILSNIFRSFHKYLQKDIGETRYQGLKQKFEWKSSVQDILKEFKEHKITSRSYIKVRTMKQMILNKKSEINGIILIALRDYLDKYSRQHFLTSKKVKKETRQNILMYIRNLQTKIDYQWSQNISVPVKSKRRQ